MRNPEGSVRSLRHPLLLALILALGCSPLLRPVPARIVTAEGVAITCSRVTRGSVAIEIQNGSQAPPLTVIPERFRLFDEGEWVGSPEPQPPRLLTAGQLQPLVLRFSSKLSCTELPEKYPLRFGPGLALAAQPV